MDQQEVHDCHHVLCTRQNTCMTYGELCTVFDHLVGWKMPILLAGLIIFLKQIAYVLKDGPVVLFVDGYH